MHPFTSYYVTLLIIAGFIAFFGWESTSRLIAYVELLLRYQVVKCQLFLMKRKLERELGLPPKNWSKEDVL
jgi:uncharacterized membrane protein